METLFKSFENIKMFHAYLERGETQPAFKDFVSSQDETKRKERDAKTKTYAEADNLLLYGDKKTAKAIEQNGVADVRANISREMQRRQVFSSVVGFAPNVPAYLAGAPNSMINQRITTQRKKVFTLAYSCAVPGHVSGKDILNACTNLLSAILKIEASGTHVNLYLCSVSDSDDVNASQRVGFAVKIKSSTERLDVLKVAYPMAHPSMNRRHKFRFLEITEGIHRNFSEGYGYAKGAAIIKKTLQENHISCDVALNYAEIGEKTTEEIIKTIKEQLEPRTGNVKTKPQKI